MRHVVLSPARPSELLSYIVNSCVYPTTLIVCATQQDFIHGFLDDELEELAEPAEQTEQTAGSRLIQESSSIIQVAVSRHIRVVFVPSVVHLRAFLAVFDPADSPIRPPPPLEDDSSGQQHKSISPPSPSLIVYDFVHLHRETSEWSAQGLSASAAVLVEAAWRTRFDAVIVDRRRQATADRQPDSRHTYAAEKVPVLSTVPRRQLQKAGYPLRSVSIRSALGRWFRFVAWAWDGSGNRERQTASVETESNHEEHQRGPEPLPTSRDEHEALEMPVSQESKEMEQQDHPPPMALRTDYVRDSEEESSLGDAPASPWVDS